MTEDPHHSDSRPGDFIGRDAGGRVKIDRVLPLPWLIGIMGAIGLQAVALYYGQQRLADTVVEMKVDVKSLANGASAAAARDVEHTLRIQSLERRVEAIEPSHRTPR